MDLYEPFEEEDEEEMDDLSECQTHAHDMNQEEDSADYQIYPFSLSEQEKTDKFTDKEEDNQSLESLNISYRNYKRQDEETDNSLSSTTEPDEQLGKTRRFTEPDVH